VIAGNTAWAGGGMGMGNFPKVTLIDCLFEGNRAHTSGGAAIHVDYDSSEITILNCTFANSQPGIASFGTHIMISDTGSAVIRNSILWNACGDPGPPITVWGSASLDMDCSIIEGGQGTIGGSSTNLVLGAGNVDADPLYCAPADCGAPVLPAGDYALDALSPAAPSWSSCGLVGAYPVECGATSVGAGVESRSWGKVKAAFRGEPSGR
jgi:hypothetical protein